MTKIPEAQLNFKDFESAIFEIMCKISCELIGQYLEQLDLSIMKMRDSKEYRLVYSQETTVKTIMGEVGFRRRYYKKRSGGYVYLLDEELGIYCGCGLSSENLAEQIVVGCTDKSFRKVASDINSFTGQAISAMGVWQIFQKYGEAVVDQISRLKELDDGEGRGHIGNVSSRVLFDEYDDVWISRQKERRQKRNSASASEKDVFETDRKLGKRPMHVGIAYSGWEQAKDGRHNTVDKIAYASFGSVSGFTSTFEVLLSQYFDMDVVERRVTNGDGESWIRTVAAENDSILQLDPYHRSKAVIKAVKGKEDRNRLFGAVVEKDVDKVLDIVETLSLNAEDEKSLKKLEDLYGYFSNNKDIFLTWQERGIELPPPPDSITYRGMGVQESNNCSLITHRMKHRRGSWSERGGDNMAMMLCFRNTVGLDAILGPLPEPTPSKAWLEPLSAAKAPQYDGKGYGADWLYAEMPFENAFRTHGRQAVRNMLRMKPLSQLTFK